MRQPCTLEHVGRAPFYPIVASLECDPRVTEGGRLNG